MTPPPEPAPGTESGTPGPPGESGLDTGGSGPAAGGEATRPAHDLAALQAVVDHWIRAHGGYWDEWANLARLTEETGEVAAAFQRLRGFRPRPTEADLGAELGDVLWVLLVIANQQGLDLAAEFDRTLARVTARDGAAWQAWAARRGEAG